MLTTFLVYNLAGAQDQTQLIKDAEAILNADLGGQPQPKCTEVSAPPMVSAYQCAVDVQEPISEKIIVVPKSHPLHQKHGIHLLSIGTEFAAINDNHVGSYLGIGGDDFGNTFGGDLALNSKWQTKTHSIRVGLDYKVRQFSKPLEGFTSISDDSRTIYVEDAKGRTYVLDEKEGEEFRREYGTRSYLRNQASMTYTILRVNMLWNKLESQSKLKPSFGGALGYRRLDDTNKQFGGKLQDNHHENMDIYRFNWEYFPNLLVDGVEKYIFVEPKVKLDFPTLHAGVCTLKSSSEFSILFNTPIAKGSNSLNLVEPKASVAVDVGLFPIKKDQDISRLNFFSSLHYDPLNRVNAYTDAGVNSFSNVGLKVKGKIGKKMDYFIVPVEFYIPLGKERDSLLGQDLLMQGGNEILGSELEKDILASWGRVGITYRFGK